MAQTKKQFNTPTIFILFGATGDLAQRKIFLALFDLFEKGFFPDNYRVLGVAHTEYTVESFRTFVRGVLCGAGHNHHITKVDDFIAHVFYHRGSFDEPKMYDNMKTSLARLDDEIGQYTNKIFHLAVSPHFYPEILQSLADQKLTQSCSAHTGWTRVLIEKPLGETMETAEHADDLLTTLFREEQVYRIDHYLGKRTIENILTFRFSNVLFAPMWHCDYITKIEINLLEVGDAAARGSFYDRVGALHDVGINHMLQIVSLMTMEHPQALQEHAVRSARARTIEQAHVVDESIVRGQYQGYKKSDGVDPASTTETFFHLTLGIDNERWRGVPIVLTSGKALDRHCTEVIVTFKEAHPCLCPGLRHEGARNQITFALQPKESITMRFLVRADDLTTTVEQKDLSFAYDAASKHDRSDAYEKIVYSAMIGDQMLFRSSEEVQAAWVLAQSFRDAWHESPLIEYEKGAAAEDIVKKTTESTHENTKDAQDDAKK